MSATLTRPPDDLRTLPHAAPERSLEQRQAALAHANEVRCQRARLKRDLKAGRQCVLDLVCDPPEWAANMKLIDLLIAVPKFGSVKVHNVLRRCQISPSKTLGGMSQRQRDELVGLLIWRLG
jgi:hypothetical protein